VKHTAVVMSLLFLAWTAGAAIPAAKKRSAAKPASGTASHGSTGVHKTATAAGKSTPQKRTSVTSSRKPAGNAKAYTRSRTTTRSGTTATRNRGGVRSAPARTYGQVTPTPDRYREIQQALVERGYLKGEPSGKWDADSVDAMRRFQQDQNIETSGQLDSLSLIALGLGPRRTAGAQARP